MRHLAGFMPKTVLPGAGELVAAAAAAYMKRVRRPDGKGRAATESRRRNRPQNRPNARRKSAE